MKYVKGTAFLLRQKTFELLMERREATHKETTQFPLELKRPPRKKVAIEKPHE